MMKANVRRAVVHQRKEIMRKRNVVGVMSGKETKDGEKTGRDAVVVLVKRKVPVAQLKSKDLVPRTVVQEGVEVPTDVIEVGEIKALHKEKHRPVVPGTSIGHFAITAGTLGVVVEKKGEKFILSNNHVLANENNARIGDAVFQPGPHDGGHLEDKVAELAEFIPIKFTSDNLVDAALARFVEVDQPDPTPEPDPTPPPKKKDFIERLFEFVEKILKSIFGKLFGSKNVKSKTVTKRAIEQVDYVNQPLNLNVVITRNVAEVDVDDVVQKSGRTTGVTVDEVLGIDAAAAVQYNDGVAEFVDQIICGPMSAGGDSGSAVFDKDGNLIGLLFAGSDTVTIVNRIQDVFDALQIEKVA